MKQFLFLTIVFILFGSARAQQIFDPAAADIPYLEHLVKIRVDAVRAKYNCTSLVNDSVLYVASVHHAAYMLSKGKLSHEETDSVRTRTPQLRAEYFGAGKDYSVGENVLYTSYNATVKGKKGEVFNTHSYEGLADAIVNGWVNSPGHFKNIVTLEYQVTGLAIAIDVEKKRVYACQKFAKVYYRYQFEENKTLFPYSTYVPPLPVTAFDSTQRTLLYSYRYAFDLRHDRLGKCDECAPVVANPPFLTLRVENNQFILRVENAEYVQQLIRDRKDGFAVEIVTYDDYACGNPAYYTRASRRNGQLRLNGKLLKPLYRDDLMKGYKKRKVRKDMRFIPYLFRKDSISFFRRFGHYKVDRFTSSYFEIRLGRVPKDIEGIWAHNLVYIQSKQICHIDYFTSYCGETYTETFEPGFIPPSSDGNYALQPEKKILHFIVPFEKGKAQYDKSEIAPFLISLEDLSFSIDSISIDAYSSIEGDSIVNLQLQQRRAESIAEIIRASQPTAPVRITTATDWEHFYNAIRSSHKWNYLYNKSHQDVLQELQHLGSNRPEELLKEERRAEVVLYCTLPVDSTNMPYLLRQEYLKVMAHLQREHFELAYLVRLDSLYGYVHHLVVKGQLPPAFLASLEIPFDYDAYHPLDEKFLFYGDEFPEAFRNNNFWVKTHEMGSKLLIKDCQDSAHLSLSFVYQCVRVGIQELLSQPGSVSEENVSYLFSLISRLEPLYVSDSTARVGIDRMSATLHLILLHDVYVSKPMEKANAAAGSMVQLYGFYDYYGLLTPQKALQLAKTAVTYNNISMAIGILMSFPDYDSALVLLMKLSYSHPSYLSSEVVRNFADSYYTRLIELAESMETSLWCSMFVQQCGIPFQAFDTEALRTVFCERCGKGIGILFDK